MEKSMEFKVGDRVRYTGIDKAFAGRIMITI